MEDIYFFKFPLEDSLAGAEFHTLKLAKHFKSQGHRVSLVSSDKKLIGLFQANGLDNKYLFAGWEPTAKWSLLFWPLTYIIAKIKFRRILKTTSAGSVFFMQSLTEKLILSPMLSTPSSSPPYQGGGRVGVWLEHKVPGRWLSKNPLLGEYLKLAKQVRMVTVSNYAKNEFMKLGVLENKINVIYPGIAIHSSSQPSFALRKGDGLRIGILSRLDPEKGVLNFLRLIAPRLPNHPNWRILVGGSGKDENKIKKIAATNSQIKLLGFVNDPDDFFPQISVLCYPSQTPESFGVAVMEAMGRGIPVIAARLGALSEIIQHEKTGFSVNPARQDEWLESLEKIENPEIYQKLSRDARLAAENFSNEKMFSAFDNLIFQNR
ncbi:glycosyltransferase family 1 protein [bacterium]|nr:MAG: glycosyltransferase family 1 protein [bacterium]